MKITKNQLRRIIKEEKQKILNEVQGMDDLEKKYSGDVRDVADAQEQIEVVLNALWDKGVNNEGLKALLNNIIRDIDRGFVGEPT